MSRANGEKDGDLGTWGPQPKREHLTGPLTAREFKSAFRIYDPGTRASRCGCGQGAGTRCEQARGPCDGGVHADGLREGAARAAARSRGEDGRCSARERAWCAVQDVTKIVLSRVWP